MLMIYIRVEQNQKFYKFIKKTTDSEKHGRRCILAELKCFAKIEKEMNLHPEDSNENNAF